MTRILAIGECMVELSMQAQDTYAAGYAGDTMNTAWYLRHLLPQTDQIDYLTAVGDDGVSDKMVAFLQNAGIGTGNIARRDGLTVGLYMIELQNGERSFNYWRGQSAARTLAQDSGFLTSALATTDIAYFSGITIAILPADDLDRLLEALSVFRARGGTVVFDPNLRPRLWRSPQDMQQAVMRAAAVSDTVLPSHEDEVTWFNDADPQATAERYAKAGASLVVVKNGTGQILAWQNGSQSLHDPAVVPHVVDTTAAGDSFNAGFLASLIQDDDLEAAINSGATLAAKVIQSHGALVDCL